MGVSNRSFSHYLVMNTFLILSSVLAAGVLGRPDGPVGHHVNLGHHQVNVGQHHQVHHGAAFHHSAPVHHNVPVVKAAPQTIAELVVGNPNFSTLLAAVKA